MKILQLCHKPPLPAKDGGCIAMDNLTQGLLNLGHKVKVLTIFFSSRDFTECCGEREEENAGDTEHAGEYLNFYL